MTDEELLLQEMTQAVRLVFDACREASTGQKIQGYAICLDDTGDMFAPVVATAEGYAGSEADTKSDYYFNPENWDIQESLAALDGVYASIQAMQKACEDYDNDDDWHEEYRTRLYQLAVRTLEKLKREGYFANEDDPYLITWVVDSEEPLMRATAWAKRLNSPTTYRKFVKWMDGYREEQD